MQSAVVEAMPANCTGPHEFTNQVQHRTKVLRWKKEGMGS
jgi:hypothetical protein